MPGFGFGLHFRLLETIGRRLQRGQFQFRSFDLSSTEWIVSCFLIHGEGTRQLKLVRPNLDYTAGTVC